jgi:peptidoglycan hydrolase-like protein with peptidoglycan-binding domain
MKMRVSRQETDRRLHSKLIAGFSAKVQKYPALAGGATALAVAMSLITVNAVWYQPEQHPSPIFATRALDMATTSSVRRVAVNRVKIVPTMRVEATPTKPDSDELTKELQMALADKEIYTGSIDGIYGSRTKTAIMTYQEQMKLKASGKVSVKLLSHILMSGKAAAHVPVPTQQVALPGSENNIRAIVESKSLVSAIQAGLKNYGYDDIVIDGVMGNQTSNAIKRFELDYGLQITGEPSNSLLKKLSDIGATGRG